MQDGKTVHNRSFNHRSFSTITWTLGFRVDDSIKLDPGYKRQIVYDILTTLSVETPMTSVFNFSNSACLSLKAVISELEGRNYLVLKRFILDSSTLFVPYDHNLDRDIYTFIEKPLVRKEELGCVHMPSETHWKSIACLTDWKKINRKFANVEIITNRQLLGRQMVTHSQVRHEREFSKETYASPVGQTKVKSNG